MSTPRPAGTPAAETLELGRGLPAWLLRVLITLTCAGLIAMVALAGATGIGVLVLLALVALGVVAAPASPAPALLVVFGAGALAVVGPDPFGVAVLVFVPLAHLLHVSSAIAGMVPVSARVHLAALRAPALRLLAVQCGVFALIGVLALIRSLGMDERSSAPMELAALLGIGVLGVLVYRLIGGRGRGHHV